MIFCKVNYMNLDQILDEEEQDMFDELIGEAKHTRADEYSRYWHHFTDEEKKEYAKTHNVPKSGKWIYKHREVMGVTSDDKDVVVHHKNHDKHDFRKRNLQIVSRAEHCKIDPNALKHAGEKCKEKGCGNDYYARGFCYKHYIAHFRKGEYGNYNPKKNRSKKER